MKRFLFAFVLLVGFLANGAQLKICSFNVQFLGQSKIREDHALASLVKDYDIVVVQELVAPPYAGQFPDGSPFKPDPEAARFFDEMKSFGFDYTLSPEDTGTGTNIHINSTATEWFVAFYKPTIVRTATDLPSGFLSAKRGKNPNFDRVPCAFAFRTADAKMDFVLISVHLRPSAGLLNAKRRKQELKAVANWIHEHDQTEKDFIILGDMNIEGDSELSSATPSGFMSLNSPCRPTNTNVNGRKPYDHVMYQTNFTGEIDQSFGFQIVDSIAALKPFWQSRFSTKYPGDAPYKHDKFRQYYSDHHPVIFALRPTMGGDDD